MAIGTRLRGILDELIATGYPDQVAERIASGDLPMDTASRMQRAEAMGFDPLNVAYHGTRADVAEFEPSVRGKMGPGIYTSPSPVVAGSYSTPGHRIPRSGVYEDRGLLDEELLVSEGANVMPLLLRGDRMERFEALKQNPDIPIAMLSEPTTEGASELATRLQREGITGLEIQGRGSDGMRSYNVREQNTFDPRDVRSLFAAFDPEYTGSNILGFQGGSQSPSLLNAATQSAVGAASMAAPETPESALYEGLTDKMVDYLTEQMGGSEEDRERAEYISMGMDFLPFIGAAKGVSETFDAYKNDDTLGMALGAGGILAGMIPFGRGAYKSAVGIAEEAPLRDIDKRFSYQPMDGGNQRKFDMARGQSLDFNVENRPLNIQSDNLSLADFEGRPYIFTQSDRSRAGGILTRVGGQDIEPIDLRGGRDFMFDAPSEGMVWASAPDVVGKLDSTAQKLAKEYGQDPLLLPYSMQPTGIDFSTFPVDAMINTARSGMSKTNIKKLDSKIKKILPDWQGVASPDSNYAFRTATGDQRKAIMRLIDSDFKDVPGGMSAAEARVVTSDPAQYTTSGGMVTNVGLLDTSKPIYADSGHPTYIAGLAGEGLGRLENPVTIMPQSRLRGRNISDTPTDAELGAAMRSMSMNPAAQIGLIDEEFLRAYYK
jgi:hypothetical protein